MADYDSQSLTANVISSDRIELNLEQVNVNPGLSDFYGYRVSYGSKSLEVGHQENRSHISIKLTDLSHNSEYTVEIQPYRVMSGQRGFGNKFPKRTFRTKCIGRRYLFWRDDNGVAPFTDHTSHTHAHPPPHKHTQRCTHTHRERERERERETERQRQRDRDN